MEIDVKLNVGTFVLLGAISTLCCVLYKQTKKISSLNKEIRSLKDTKGEAIM